MEKDFVENYIYLRYTCIILQLYVISLYIELSTQCIHKVIKCKKQSNSYQFVLLFHSL